MEIVDKKEISSEIMNKIYEQMKSGIEKMTLEQTKMLMSLLMSGDKFKVFDLDPNNAMHQEISKMLNACETIMYKRCLEQYGLKVELGLRLMLASMLSSPGDMVLMGTYIAHWMYLNNKKELTLNDACSGLFAWGFPSKEAMQNAWQYQKNLGSPNSNVLDDPKTFDYLREWLNK